MGLQPYFLKLFNYIITGTVSIAMLTLIVLITNSSILMEEPNYCDS